MRILHMHTSMGQGGIEAIVCGLVNEMSKQHDVSLCTIFARREDQVFERQLSSRVCRFDLGKTKQGFSLREIFKIYRFIRKGHYDIVHIHGFFYYYALAIVLLHKRVRFVYTIHSDARMECSSWDNQIFPLKRYAFRHGWMHAVTISRESQRSFTDLYHADSTLIYNGVEEYSRTPSPSLLQEYRYTPNTLLFLHPGRITKAKNQLVLCQVFQRLIMEKHDIVLLIAGSNDDEHIYQQIEPFFSDRIVYLGARTDVRDMMCRADAFCLPSIWEGMPVTLLEAISVGCIPICAPVGGIPEIVLDAQTGFLSSDSSKEAYYLAVKRFLALSVEERTSISARCKLAFKPFSVAHISQQYVELYNSLQ